MWLRICVPEAFQFQKVFDQFCILSQWVMCFTIYSQRGREMLYAHEYLNKLFDYNFFRFFFRKTSFHVLSVEIVTLAYGVLHNDTFNSRKFSALNTYTANASVSILT